MKHAFILTFCATVVTLAVACNGGWQANYRYQVLVGPHTIYTNYVPVVSHGEVCLRVGYEDLKGRGDAFEQRCYDLAEDIYKLNDRGQK